MSVCAFVQGNPKSRGKETDCQFADNAAFLATTKNGAERELLSNIYDGSKRSQYPKDQINATWQR